MRARAHVRVHRIVYLCVCKFLTFSSTFCMRTSACACSCFSRKCTRRCPVSVVFVDSNIIYFIPCVHTSYQRGVPTRVHILFLLLHRTARPGPARPGPARPGPVGPGRLISYVACSGLDLAGGECVVWSPGGSTCRAAAHSAVVTNV